MVSLGEGGVKGAKNRGFQFFQVNNEKITLCTISRTMSKSYTICFKGSPLGTSTARGSSVFSGFYNRNARLVSSYLPISVETFPRGVSRASFEKPAMTRWSPAPNVLTVCRRFVCYCFVLGACRAFAVSRLLHYVEQVRRKPRKVRRKSGKVPGTSSRFPAGS